MQRNAAVFAALNLSLISISIFHSDQGQKPHLCGSGSLLPPASFPPWDSLGLACLFAPDAFNQGPSPGFLSLPLCGGHSPSESEGLTDSELRPPVGPQADLLCTFSALCRHLDSGRCVLLASGFRTFVEFLPDSSTFLLSQVPLCSAQGFLSWSGVGILALRPFCFLPHLLPYVRSQDSAVA